MKKGSLFLLIVILFSIGACRNKSRIEKDLLMLKTRPIDLSLESMVMIDDYSIDRCFEPSKQELKIIHFISSSECSICEIETLKFWEVLLDSLQRKKICPIIIIDPGIRYSINQIKSSIAISTFTYAVYIDTGGVFYSNNPHIPESSIMHTFLVDKDNNVVIAGNPILNPGVFELLKNYEKGK